MKPTILRLIGCLLWVSLSTSCFANYTLTDQFSAAKDSITHLEAKNLTDDGEIVMFYVAGGTLYQVWRDNDVLMGPDSIASSPDCAGIQLYDVNKDGDQDIVFASNKNKTIAYLPLKDGLPNGEVKVLLTDDKEFNNFVVAKLDDDNYPDIVLSNKGQKNLEFYWSDQSLTFVEGTSAATLDEPTDDIVVLDYDGNGDNDVAFMNAQARAVTWVRNNSSRSFGFETRHEDLSMPLKTIMAYYKSDFDELLISRDGLVFRAEIQLSSPVLSQFLASANYACMEQINEKNGVRTLAMVDMSSGSVHIYDYDADQDIISYEGGADDPNMRMIAYGDWERDDDQDLFISVKGKGDNFDEIWVLEKVNLGGGLPDAIDPSLDRASKRLKLYPVPAQEYLGIELLEAGSNYQVSIKSLDGKTVMTKNVTMNNGQYLLDVANVNNGTYFLELSNSSEGRITRTFTIQR